MVIQKTSDTFKAFVDGVTDVLIEVVSEEIVLEKVSDLMRSLVAEDNWLDPAFAAEHPEYYQQYLLYADPEDRFSVVSFVWGAGQSTPIHDHTVWGVIGMLRGAEYAQSYELNSDGQLHAIGKEVQLQPGDVESVSPTIGDIHKVRNAYHDQTSISVHVYGGNIGKIHRHVFIPETGEVKDFVSGYANEQL